MKYIKGQNRAQTYLLPVSRDDAVDVNNEVRFIDVFVDTIRRIINIVGLKTLKEYPGTVILFILEKMMLLSSI